MQPIQLQVVYHVLYTYLKLNRRGEPSQKTLVAPYLKYISDCLTLKSDELVMGIQKALALESYFHYNMLSWLLAGLE